jgi:two-component system sensor histidine kinase KdpD
MITAQKWHLSSLLWALVGVSLTTSLGYWVQHWLGSSGLAMVYLLLVLLTSLYLSFSGALLTGVLSFFALNFFFVEPRYTFHVSSPQVFIELVGFLAVAITIVSLTERLKNQTLQAKTSQHHAEAARLLAEKLLTLGNERKVIEIGSQAIEQALEAHLIVVRVADEVFSLYNPLPDDLNQLDSAAAKWCVEHQQPIGYGTGNWADLAYWCMLLQERDVVFVLPNEKTSLTLENLAFLKGLVDQMSLALGLLIAKKREQEAIRQAERESVQHALLASLSHDFRTPLTAILGAASTLSTQRDQLSTTQQQDLLATIVDESAQMVDDAENILTLTRMETLGQAATHLDWQVPEEIIGIVAARCRRRYPKANLSIDVASSLPMIRVDLVLVVQALMNLLENAFKFDHSGLPISLSAYQQDQHVIVGVRDHGIGLPTDNELKLHGKFVRGKPESAQPGFGLGLAICDAVARLHHGSLQLLNATDGGLIARLHFPLQPLDIEINA